MSSTNESEFIASMEDMEAQDDTADSFSEGDLVFAKSIGYIAWPGIIVAKQCHHSMVTFLGSDDTRRIDNAKIWPYNESTKAQYLTNQNLEYEEFMDAVLIAEKLNCFEGNKENGDYCYRVLHNSDLEEYDDKEKESQEEARQGAGSPTQEKSKKPGHEEPNKEEHADEKHAEEKHAEMKHGKEEHTEKQHADEQRAEEQHAKEEPDKDEPGKEEPDQKESVKEARRNEANSITYIGILRSSHDSLCGDVEKNFIEIVNFLRDCLKVNQKDYTSALLALAELHEMPLSELILVRNFEAVNSIYLICFLDTAHRNYHEATHVKVLAKQLLIRIALMFNVSDTITNFMDLFRSLAAIYRRYTQEFEPPQPPQKSSKEEYGHEFVAVEEDGQESLALEDDGQDALAVKEDGQEGSAMEEDGQEGSTVEEDGQDTFCVEEDGQEGLTVEEDGQEGLAVEEDGQDTFCVEEDGQEGLAVEKDGQEGLAMEENGQEGLAFEDNGQENGPDALGMKEDGQEGSAVEEDGQEGFAVEKDGQEGLALEDNGQEDGPDTLAVEEDEEEAMYSLDQYFPTWEIDERFNQLINILRRTLTFRQKDYPVALSAFDELLSFTYTKEFLMPKYKAVYFIYYLGRSGCVFPWNDLAKATLVRNLANQLMTRFFAVFNLPGITAYDFMVHFCSLYPENIPFEWEND